MELNNDLYRDEGMYVHCENGTVFNFSLKNVEILADEYWNNPEKLSNEIKYDELFKTCSVCPYRGKDVLCSAIKPLLPFLENLDDFKSLDPVTVVCRDSNGVLSVKNTDMQNALQYLTDMSVNQYCEDMKKYKEYYSGIRPLSSTQENVQTLLLNIFWKSDGDRDKTRSTIKELQKAIDITTRNCIDRLHLICRSDAFKNAYVRTHILGDLIAGYSEKFLEGKGIAY
ncbi:hypothetical protein ACFL1N_03075 [Thermodesulfobacteriota bacterium]